MASVLNTTPQTPSPHELLRSKFALYQGGGDIWVICNSEIAAYQAGSQRIPEFLRRPAANILMNRELESLPVACKPQEVIRQFFHDPRTHKYDGLAYSPLPQPENILNLWRSPQLKPRCGDWSVIRKHLLEVICDGNRSHFSYLLRYLAHMLQHPEIKPGVMIVLLGGQGTGKGALFTILSRIWTHSVLRVSDIEQITGRFNAALAQAYVVCMDEALFVGDRKSQDKMKSLITEPIISIEQKHQPQHCINSYHRYFSASNHEHFAQIENDDRRYFVLRLSSCYQQDTRYFLELFNAINSDSAISAFMHVLANIDITNFNPRSAPKTNAHAEQRMMSLPGFERYWHHILWVGVLPGGTYSKVEWSTETFVRTEDLSSDATRFDPHASRFRPVASQDIAKELARLCPSAKPGRDRYGKRRGYDLPPISVARREFEAAKGLRVDWGESSAYPNQMQSLKAALSARRGADDSGRFREFARQTRQIKLNL